MKYLLPILCCAAFSATQAAIKLPDIFADHMVVQRNAEIPVWGTAAPGAQITAEFAGKSATAAADASGAWSLKLPALPEGGPFELKVSGDGEIAVHDVLVGDVWLSSGQSNLTYRMVPNLPYSEGALNWEKEVAAANNPKLRFFEVVINSAHTPSPEVFGSWLQTNPTDVRFVSAVSYFFGQGLQKEIGVPVGVIVSGRGGTSIRSWLPKDVMEQFPEFKQKLGIDAKTLEKNKDAVDKMGPTIAGYVEKYKKAQLTDGKVPSFPNPFPNYATSYSYLYNAMIAPLTRVPITGFIYYQGESDSQNAKDYAGWFKALIESRRKQWNLPNAPFIFVQIANYDPVKARDLEGDKAEKLQNAWAAQRLSQAAALELPHTAMATAADAGLAEKVHPPDKKTVGDRLVRGALALQYGRSIPYRGPQVTSITNEGGKVVLAFQTEGGAAVKIKDGLTEITGFEVAGADGTFKAATATLDGGKVILTSEVGEPTQVRYAFADDPKLSLYDTNGLPLTPFIKTVGK